jgi:integrase
MKGSYRKRGCKCSKDKRCTCGATWSFRIDYTDPKTGRRLQPEFTGYATKKEAETACAAKITEVENGTFTPEKKITFKVFTNDWIEEISRSKKDSTVRTRKFGLKVLLTCFAFEQMTNINRKSYEKALNDLLDQGYADNTITIVHSTARLIFKAAMQDDVIKKNPLQYATVPRIEKTVEELEDEEEIVKYLEKDDLSTFLKLARTRGLENDYLVFLILAYTGLRIGELCALKWRDIDFENKTLSVTKTLYNPTNKVGVYKLLPPKTKESKRIMDVDDLVITELKKHLTKQKELIMKKRNIYHDKDFIIVHKKNHGYPEPIHTFNNRMNRLLKIAKLNMDLTPHSLRHTHTSLMAEAGATLPEIMARLGHKDDEVTKTVYLHVTKPVQKKTSQKFSELMRSL